MLGGSSCCFSWLKVTHARRKTGLLEVGEAHYERR